MSVVIPSIRNCIRSQVSPLRLQRRWARVHEVRFVATHRDQQQIQERYKDKLERKAKQEGHQSVDSLKAAYKEKITELRRTTSTIPTPPSTQPSQAAPVTPTVNTSPQPINSYNQPPPPPPQPQSQSQSKTQQPSSGAPGIQPLSSYIDIDKLQGLSHKDLEKLWRLRFASNPLSLCAVIPLETYKRMYTNARAHPQFILPLPRPDTETDNQQPGTTADIHFLQWAFHPPTSPPQGSNTHISTVMFTHLAAFKVHGAYAQPHTVVTHHLDLADSHGVVLLHGAVVEKRGVNPDEATWLLMCLQKFYDTEGHGGGIGRERRKSLLEKFSRGDVDGFKVQELMDEAERVS